MGVSRPCHTKNGHFLPKNAMKMPILGQKHCFLGLAMPPPPPVLQVADSNKHVLHGMDSGKWVFEGRRTQKKGHFLL